MTTFPTSIDSYNTHSIGDTIDPVNDNSLQSSVVVLETKVDIDSSADTNLLDYRLKSTSSVNPGHKHSLSTSTPADGELMRIRVHDNGTARAISFGTNHVAKAGVANTNQGFFNLM